MRLLICYCSMAMLAFELDLDCKKLYRTEKYSKDLLLESIGFFLP